MTDDANLLDETDGDESETVLDAALWMLDDAGIYPPPLPASELDELMELSAGSIYATHEELATLIGSDAIADQIAETGRWPAPGVAFGLIPAGLGGRWFYTLCGEHALLHVHIRLLNDTAERSTVGFSTINFVHRRLEAYLSNEINASRYNRPYAPVAGASREIRILSNETGLLRETAAFWSETDGLGQSRPDQIILESTAVPEPAPEELMVFRL